MSTEENERPKNRLEGKAALFYDNDVGQYALAMPKRGDKELVPAQEVVLAALLYRLMNEPGFYQEQIDHFEKRIEELVPGSIEAMGATKQ